MSYTTYILQNNLTKRYYIGSTNDIVRRLREHNRHQTKSTQSLGGWTVVWQESFLIRTDAVRKERLIKSYKGGNAFKQLLKRE